MKANVKVNPQDPVAVPLLGVEGLSLQMGGRWLCRELSFRLDVGECLVLLGPNGAGKTTLLHTLAGLHTPQSGEVKLAGRLYARWPARAAARCRGLLAQRQPDHFAASVLETVLIGRHPHLGRWSQESEEDQAIALNALAAVGLAEFAGREVLSLSGGERQRVAIASLLAQTPQLMLLDEPLNHLDLRYQIAILDLLRARVHEGVSDQRCAAVLVLHDINLAARYADRVILLDGKGGVVAGTRAEVMRSELLSAAFSHPLHSVSGPHGNFFVPA